MSIRSKITYTFTDEAPALATYSLLPIVKAFAASAGIDVETSDISLAGRILANFADRLDADQRIEDDLARLAVLATSPDANIIKLPNISASVPQLKGAIAELQGLGYKVPDFPEDPQTDEEKEVRARYAKILGSAVNPVLREGNSDRRAPAAVKAYARKHPHSMGKWSMASRSHADYMRGGDFFSSEQSITMAKAGDVRIEFVGKDGKVEVKKQLSLQEGEVLDSMFMSCGKLRDFFEKTLQDCKETGVMWSLHVKATMMKISHPIVFGHAVSVYYKDVFDKWGQLFEELGVNPNNGISSVYDKIKSLPASQQEEILHDIHEVYSHRPEMAMVDSVKGITNLHIPSDVIVDASMPAMIRNSGQMGQGRQAERHQGGNAGKHLRPHLPGDDQLLQDQRRLRPDHHGQRAERRPDGAEGRGIRLPRQDLRNDRRRHHARGPGRRQRADAARGGDRRHLARLPDQGRADPRLGQAGRHPRAPVRHPGDLLAGPGARPRPRTAQEGRATSRTTT